MSLRDAVNQSLVTYFDQMGDEMPTGLYEMVISEVERPLLSHVMQQAQNNQCKAAQMLGLNRGTLRKKLKHYQLID
ncbi:MAG: DNA-binding transcriptional regulator Fis [Proteobacteria bacterium]|jgi:Fis family transcriptional regulator, factor for inversion stimulation protein|nr:DNA-binding transcriptional regulator Fis [Pseudomonadota bacterium]MDA0954042.1 DNA-binding transcriptional regulator Fis [Pseudomonadota bacterium]HBZ48972.1 DNA-binding transcriptional regulator Fis [Halieaceae bacterium]